MKAILTGLVVTPLLLVGWVAVQLAWQRAFGTETNTCGTSDACCGCREQR